MKVIDEIKQQQDDLLKMCDRLESQTEQHQQQIEQVFQLLRRSQYRYKRELRKRLHAQRRLHLISQAIDLQGWLIGRNL